MQTAATLVQTITVTIMPLMKCEVVNAHLEGTLEENHPTKPLIQPLLLTLTHRPIASHVGFSVLTNDTLTCGQQALSAADPYSCKVVTDREMDRWMDGWLYTVHWIQ